MNGISSSNAVHDQNTRAGLGEAREKEHVRERGPSVKNDHSKPGFEERRETSVNCSHQAAVSSEDLHPLSIFFSGRLGFLESSPTMPWSSGHPGKTLPLPAGAYGAGWFATSEGCTLPPTSLCGSR